MKKHTIKMIYQRMLSAFLAFCMVMSLFGGIGPLHAHAATGEGTGTETLPVTDEQMRAAVQMAADKATDLATLSDGATLSSGVYYLSENKTFGSRSTWNNGLKIKDGATVYIYVPTGVTLKAIGGGTKTARQEGGKAGILLPKDSTLILLGGGTVVAQGGHAGNGLNGNPGGTGDVNTPKDFIYSGYGGAGGAGGGGAGAGIGTNGGSGGAGGDSTSYGKELHDGEKNYDGADGGYGTNNGTPINNGNGKNGRVGGTADACGTLYAESTLTISAAGGEKGNSGGAGGAAGEWDKSQTEWEGKDFHVAGGGGGGGGGGAGYQASPIGTGGAGGGGGGGGGRGAVDFSESDFGGDTPSSYANCMGGGGTGGQGAATGSNGGGIQDTSSKSNGTWNKIGGAGGGRGSAGGQTFSKSAINTNLPEVTYTVTFKDAAGTISTDTYTFGTTGTVTVPDYTAQAGKCFLGWEVRVYGANAGETAAADLTSTAGGYTDKKVYQPGQTITVEVGVSGSIELEPILGELTGTAAQTEVLTIPAAEMEEQVTYYTYVVETTLDGVTTDMGNLTLKDSAGKEYIISYENGCYTYITSENTTYDIWQNGKTLGTVSGAIWTEAEKNPTVIPYKSFTITTTVNGAASTAPGDVTITGADAPAITTDPGSGVYKGIDLAANANAYRILVGGTDTGKTISLDENKTIDYYSTTVTVGGNTNAQTVALRENGGNKTYLLSETDTNNKFMLMKQPVDGTYTLYVDGIKTEFDAIDLSQQNEISVNLYTTRIKTTLDGNPADMNRVEIGTQQAIRESEGSYYAVSVMSDAAPTVDVTIGNRNVGTVTLGTEETVAYYSVDYVTGSQEADMLPTDSNVYLTGDPVTVLPAVTAKDSAYTFSGWKFSGNVKQPGETFTMPAGKVTFEPNWTETVYDISYEMSLEIEADRISHTNPDTAFTRSSNFTLVKPTAQGYIFEGWTYKDVIVPQKEVKIADVIASILGSDAEEERVLGPLTFEAHWIEKTYAITADTSFIDFGTRRIGYSGDSMPAAELVEIASSGNQDITISSVTCDSTNFELNTSGMVTLLSGNGDRTQFTVQPKSGLTDGTYTGTITVTTIEGNAVTIALQFVVGPDTTPPAAAITIGANTWDDIVFEPEEGNEVYYNSEKEITITAADTETLVDKVLYYISSDPLVWSDDEMEWCRSNGKTISGWKNYDEQNKPTISAVGTYYVYARATDSAEPANVTDISTDTIIIEKTPPAVVFVDSTDTLKDQGIYVLERTVKVTDQKLVSVTLNGTACEIAEDGTCTFVVYPDKDELQEIVAADAAGNVTTIQLTVNPDENAPTGVITLQEREWTSFLNTITFGIYFNKTQNVIITAEDSVNGPNYNTGVDKISYYLSEEPMTESELDALSAESWKEYTKKFAVDPDQNLIVYANIVDRAENSTYISSDGVVLDATAPTIRGVKSGLDYCGSQTVIIKDVNLDTVTVNGTTITLTNDAYELTAGAEKTEYVIVATDKAGNSESYTVTLHPEGAHIMEAATCTKSSMCARSGCTYTVGAPLGHIWSDEWKVIKQPTKTTEGIKETVCTRGCKATKSEVIPETEETAVGLNLTKSRILDPETTIEKATFNNSRSELLASDIFTPAEKAQIQNGEETKIWLEINKTDEKLLTEDDIIKFADAAKAQGASSKMRYFEADLFKQVGSGTVEEINNTDIGIKITIAIPKDLLNHNSTVSRTYYVLRLHAGDVDTITGTFRGGEFTFETDRFSTYAIAYKDTAVPVHGSGGSSSDNTLAESTDPSGTTSGIKKNKGPKKNAASEDAVKENVPNHDTGNAAEELLGENSGKNPQLSLTNSVPKEVRDPLADAVEQIQDRFAQIQAGPYVMLPTETEDSDELTKSETFTIEIPEELVKEERAYYLVTVDEHGAIVILQAAQTEDGKLTFTGDPNAVYRLVYEDGSKELAESINENGYLVNENGEILSVKQENCFWHYIILAVCLIGIVCAIFFRKKRKLQLLAWGVTAALMILVTVVGKCFLDVLFTIAGILLMAVMSIRSKNNNQ